MAQRSRVDINIFEGNEEPFAFTITQASDSSAYDFSGADSVSFICRQHRESVDVLFTQNATDGQDGNDWANGIAKFKITPANTRLLSGNGWYQVRITPNGGQPITAGWGEINFQREI